eukprot:487355_1
MSAFILVLLTKCFVAICFSQQCFASHPFNDMILRIVWQMECCYNRLATATINNIEFDANHVIEANSTSGLVNEWHVNKISLHNSENTANAYWTILWAWITMVPTNGIIFFVALIFVLWINPTSMKCTFSTTCWLMLILAAPSCYCQTQDPHYCTVWDWPDLGDDCGQFCKITTNTEWIMNNHSIIYNPLSNITTVSYDIGVASDHLSVENWCFPSMFNSSFNY